MAPTAGEEFSFQLQHLTEDLFSLIFLIFMYVFLNATAASIKKLCLVFVQGVNGDAHTCSNQLVQTQSASCDCLSVHLLLDARRKK